MFELLSKYFWTFAIVVNCINTISARSSIEKFAAQYPERRLGYQQLFWGYLVVSMIPWMVMGICMTIGNVPTVWHYFRPRDGNLFVLAWHLTIILLLIVGSVWIYFRHGDEFLEKHPSVMPVRVYFSIKTSYTRQSARLLWALGLICTILGEAMMWIWNPPVPV